MSGKNLIGSDDWPSYEPYSTLQEAIAGAARFIPAHHPEFLLLFEQTQKLALDCGYEWGIPETALLAMAILNAIMEYGEKAAGPGLEPKELEAWLNKSKRLARELRQILRSQEGQDRFAHIISQGYPSDELANPLGPTPETNVLLNLLEQIEREGPLSKNDALDFKLEQSDDEFVATEPSLREVFAVEAAAATTLRGQDIHKRIDDLFVQFSNSTPNARDPIRRHLIAEVIRCSCRCLGADASRSLISGNTPWKLL